MSELILSKVDNDDILGRFFLICSSSLCSICIKRVLWWTLPFWLVLNLKFWNINPFRFWNVTVVQLSFSDSPAALGWIWSCWEQLRTKPLRIWFPKFFSESFASWFSQISPLSPTWATFWKPFQEHSWVENIVIPCDTHDSYPWNRGEYNINIPTVGGATFSESYNRWIIWKQNHWRLPLDRMWLHRTKDNICGEGHIC